MDKHWLKEGSYIICDPAYIIKKNKDGDRFHQKLITLFYKDMNTFHIFDLDGIIVYMFRSLGGDGIFDGVATDTGTFVIIDTHQLINDHRFRQSYDHGKIIKFTAKKPVLATYNNFDLSLSNGIFIHTE